MGDTLGTKGPGRRASVVALGGGHGLHASLSALRLLTNSLTAVVTVADDGGSSGRLRSQMSILPPGDLRMALNALRGDDSDDELWAQLFQHRFSSGDEMTGHAVGNLILAGLFDLMESPVQALAVAGRMLGLPQSTRVLPSAGEPLTLVATLSEEDGSQERLVGQNAIALANGRVGDVAILPAEPLACPEAVEAIMEADWVFLGPGSWYSSVVPHLLVPSIRQALLSTKAKKAVTLNLIAEVGETDDYTPSQHLEALARYAPGMRLECIFVDDAAHGLENVRSTAWALFGARVIVADVAAHEGVHSPVKLAAAYAQVIPHDR